MKQAVGMKNGNITISGKTGGMQPCICILCFPLYFLIAKLRCGGAALVVDLVGRAKLDSRPAVTTMERTTILAAGIQVLVSWLNGGGQLSRSFFFFPGDPRLLLSPVLVPMPIAGGSLIPGPLLVDRSLCSVHNYTSQEGQKKKDQELSLLGNMAFPGMQGHESIHQP